MDSPPNPSPPPQALAGARATLEHWAGGDTKPEGFYIPHRYAANLSPGIPDWLRERFAHAAPAMRTYLEQVFALETKLRTFGTKRAGDPHGPRFDQDWFSGLDAALAYTMVYTLAPATIVEVGSGHSTRFLARALEAIDLETRVLETRELEPRATKNGDNRRRLISIDPEPRRPIDALCFEVYRSTVSDCPVSLFKGLKAGDILFIDGSHVLMPGTDVDRLFTGVLPILPPGVVVHIHDIFLPDPYPQAWNWRNYNEQLLVAALLGTGRFKILAASHYLRQYHAAWLDGIYAPVQKGAYESSLWVELT
ncbi:MAG: class I SAM-dependent methyltransferase [Gammaproteobacteria bacterium]|nr:class I SAM-dependent methyltransferase [Gammaproteobacteria bacterium]